MFTVSCSHFTPPTHSTYIVASQIESLLVPCMIKLLWYHIMPVFFLSFFVSFGVVWVWWEYGVEKRIKEKSIISGPIRTRCELERLDVYSWCIWLLLWHTFRVGRMLWNGPRERWNSFFFFSSSSFLDETKLLLAQKPTSCGCWEWSRDANVSSIAIFISFCTLSLNLSRC